MNLPNRFSPPVAETPSDNQLLVNMSQKSDVSRSFGAAAGHYEEFAHLQRYMGTQLLRKTQAVLPMHTRFETCVDLGCGTGFFSPEVAELFGAESVIGLDISEGMLQQAVSHKVDLKSVYFTAGDAEALPFANNSLNAVFSNLAVQWCKSVSVLFAELMRSVDSGGVVALSTLLEGSLAELKQSWATVDDEQHVNSFLELADYRNAAASIGFELLDIEQEAITLEYDQTLDLMRDLKGVGAHNISTDRPKRLTGKNKIKKVVDAYENYRLNSGRLPATYQAAYLVLRKCS
jgi:malonyl-CoA O-methyltransferase